jgi:hypothetical protein
MLASAHERDGLDPTRGSNKEHEFKALFWHTYVSANLFGISVEGSLMDNDLSRHGRKFQERFDEGTSNLAM